VIEGHQIVELNRPAPVKNQYTFREGYLYSLNIVFAQIGLDVGTVRMNEYTRKFGFGQAIPFDFLTTPYLPVEPSRVSNDPNYLSSKTALADTAFGQGELQVTPLEMALVTAAVVNGGKIPQPYLVDSVRAPDGRVLDQTRPKTWLTPMRAETADQVRGLMVDYVEKGGGALNARIQGLVVGGKTGTAEVGDGTSHSWFICFGGKPNQQPEIVVAVIAEHAGHGADVALPIATQVVKAYFARP
jgi:penicillin-binding protein A